MLPDHTSRGIHAKCICSYRRRRRGLRHGRGFANGRGEDALSILARLIGPRLIGTSLFDHVVTVETVSQNLVKLGHNSILSAALAAVDIALWDLKGKVLGRPIYELLGGAWRQRLPLYSSIGGNADRSVDEVLHGGATCIG